MFIKLYLITLPVFFIIDMIWLGLIAKNFYAKHIGFLMKTNINWTSAIIFYLVFIAGLIIFVIMPSMEKNSWVMALLLGTFFGFVTYATYDLTNLATIRDWPLLVTIIDLIWGTVLASSVSVVSFFIASKIGI
jgi:uncharacterized membrane protein